MIDITHERLPFEEGFKAGLLEYRKSLLCYVAIVLANLLLLTTFYGILHQPQIVAIVSVCLVIVLVAVYAFGLFEWSSSKNAAPGMLYSVAMEGLARPGRVLPADLDTVEALEHRLRGWLYKIEKPEVTLEILLVARTVFGSYKLRSLRPEPTLQMAIPKLDELIVLKSQSEHIDRREVYALIRDMYESLRRW